MNKTGLRINWIENGVTICEKLIKPKAVEESKENTLIYNESLRFRFLLLLWFLCTLQKPASNSTTSNSADLLLQTGASQWDWKHWTWLVFKPICSAHAFCRIQLAHRGKERGHWERLCLQRRVKESVDRSIFWSILFKTRNRSCGSSCIDCFHVTSSNSKI